MWVKFVVISLGRDLNNDNNENQHLRVILMAKIYIRERLGYLHERAKITNDKANTI